MYLDDREEFMFRISECNVLERPRRITVCADDVSTISICLPIRARFIVDSSPVHFTPDKGRSALITGHKTDTRVAVLRVPCHSLISQNAGVKRVSGPLSSERAYHLTRYARNDFRALLNVKTARYLEILQNIYQINPFSKLELRSYLYHK